MSRFVVALAAVVALLAAACGASDVVVAPAAPASTEGPVAPTTATPETTAGPDSTTEPPQTTVLAVTTVPGDPVLLVEGTPMIRFSIDVGEGVDLDRDDLARFVVETLTDERSWIGRGAGFELLDEGGDFTMIVALPDDVDDMCAPLRTIGRYSCARNGWIAFNSLRWFGATDDWPADLETYRRYLVNHEVGHYVLGPGHDACPAAGAIAPVMMQQTKGLDGCLANGWVDP